MTSAIILFAALSTAVAAQVGSRHPYGIYPSPSVTSSSSSTVVTSYGGYPTSVIPVNTTLSSTSSLPSSSSSSASSIDTTSLSMSSINATSSSMSSTDTSTIIPSTTTSAVSLTSVTSDRPLSWTTNSNGTVVLGTSTTSTAETTSDAAATTTTGATSSRATCVSVTIGDVSARGICGCDYNIHTCLERLSNLSEWSNSQTTESFNGCMKACDSEPNCFSFSWQISNGVCKMFGGMLNGGAGVVSDADFISGEVVKGSCTGNCSGQ
ncbi:hypothetical protein AUEXF2481DRAFT_30600 [Aureobasidium subglaciale EXF-2481]|uniref:Apple domain-containing protein n=1 Tax=Aureobasidium subglaciale (strain EXF-2481) TaxID=1043005 RepID=A0A074YDC5_AURSE|nr:uncharacterized protein AUEXF2481DRAFT_30600 [Aureobasidium subglaciale EXF-2481]KAI5208451.1 hypothetical protein E4T38_02960 [Aureobasidium subglaciale]KAI5227255.1 hypothetical protein E4T40_02603 [Aureobasidium subglaciale]KAI5230580.1 hypothetical protein E4T41_02959 [Aureobasidium subglaciale]KAI5264934.1 hypothetical protein E4T46_02737 [Aureobasidium subglaciale]KEQ94049.1 hypothetical protein AUEXF2481DRAFT_30600 [Aureobasidium subglaciale EXF-2481]